MSKWIIGTYDDGSLKRSYFRKTKHHRIKRNGFRSIRWRMCVAKAIKLDPFMKSFTENQWNHLHDVVLEATWETTKTKMNQDELEHLFSEFPENIKQDAYRWGLNDTMVRDKVYVWYKENKLT